MADENNRSLFHRGYKDPAAGRIDVSAGTQMPPGITSMKPLQTTPTTHKSLGANRIGAGKSNGGESK
jgi:hypothetical protein